MVHNQFMQISARGRKIARTIFGFWGKINMMAQIDSEDFNRLLIYSYIISSTYSAIACR